MRIRQRKSCETRTGQSIVPCLSRAFDRTRIGTSLAEPRPSERCPTEMRSYDGSHPAVASIRDLPVRAGLRLHGATGSSERASIGGDDARGSPRPRRHCQRARLAWPKAAPGEDWHLADGRLAIEAHGEALRAELTQVPLPLHGTKTRDRERSTPVLFAWQRSLLSYAKDSRRRRGRPCFAKSRTSSRLANTRAGYGEDSPPAANCASYCPIQNMHSVVRKFDTTLG
jgi:hypothetical protein